MFASITALSFIFFTSCTDDVCNTDYINIINVVIISFGILGLVYCFFILKDFNKKVDDEILPEYKEMLKDLDEEKDDKKDKKLLSF